MDGRPMGSPAGEPMKGSAVRISNRIRFVSVGLLVVPAALPVSVAHARDHDDRDAPAPAGTVSADVGFAMYFWLPSIGGESGIDGMDVDIDLSFTDILDDSDHVVGFMGQVELNINRFLVLFDPTWTRMEKDDVGMEADVDLTLDTLWIDVNAGYRFVDRAALDDDEGGVRMSVDGLVGLRATLFDVELDGPAPEDPSRSESWVDPLVGTRVTFDFGEHIALALRGDIGGFGVGSDLSAHLLGAFGYRFPIGEADAAVFAGYRALYQDYDDDGFLWRAWVHGPMLGLQIRF